MYSDLQQADLYGLETSETLSLVSVERKVESAR